MASYLSRRAGRGSPERGSPERNAQRRPSPACAGQRAGHSRSPLQRPGSRESPPRSAALIDVGLHDQVLPVLAAASSNSPPRSPQGRLSRGLPAPKQRSTSPPVSQEPALEVRQLLAPSAPRRPSPLVPEASPTDLSPQRDHSDQRSEFLGKQHNESVLSTAQPSAVLGSSSRDLSANLSCASVIECSSASQDGPPPHMAQGSMRTNPVVAAKRPSGKAERARPRSRAGEPTEEPPPRFARQGRMPCPGGAIGHFLHSASAPSLEGARHKVTSPEASPEHAGDRPMTSGSWKGARTSRAAVTSTDIQDERSASSQTWRSPPPSRAGCDSGFWHSRSTGHLPLTNVGKLRRRENEDGFLPEVLGALPPGRSRKAPPMTSWMSR